ncbi:hypothetical protein EDB84DRAFT_1647042 [Lactarius hengduanensis]|nr:hypothetical protein EDB84DRAFT_1647042 [Lactarius hengduanensis]
MPFWGCVRGNASLQVDFEPETTLVLVLSARVDAGACFPSTRRRQCSIAASRHHRITPPSLLLNRFQMTLFKFACKLLRALLKAVWRGLKRAIGPLVTRINGMGWRIRMDLKVHLNVVTGSGDVVDRSFGPIRFEFSHGIKAIPSIEGADQNSPLLSEHFLGGCILFFEHRLPRRCQYDNPALAASSAKHYLHRQYLQCQWGTTEGDPFTKVMTEPPLRKWLHLLKSGPAVMWGMVVKASVDWAAEGSMQYRWWIPRFRCFVVGVEVLKIVVEVD